MQDLIQFMNGSVGRVARVLLGVALIYVGLVSVGGTPGTIIAAVGVLPIGFGVVGRCMVEFLPGAH